MATSTCSSKRISWLTCMVNAVRAYTSPFFHLLGRVYFCVMVGPGGMVLAGATMEIICQIWVGIDTCWWVLPHLLSSAHHTINALPCLGGAAPGRAPGRCTGVAPTPRRGRLLAALPSPQWEDPLYLAGIHQAWGGHYM